MNIFCIATMGKKNKRPSQKQRLQSASSQSASTLWYTMAAEHQQDTLKQKQEALNQKQKEQEEQEQELEQANLANRAKVLEERKKQDMPYHDNNCGNNGNSTASNLLPNMTEERITCF